MRIILRAFERKFEESYNYDDTHVLRQNDDGKWIDHPHFNSEGSTIRKTTGLSMSASMSSRITENGRPLPNKLWEGFEKFLVGSNITKLSLRYDWSIGLSFDEYEIFGKALARSKVTSLNLTGNRFGSGDRSFEQEVEAFLLDSKSKLIAFHGRWQTLKKALVASKVTTLNLCGNNLHAFSAEEWGSFGKILAASKVTKLNLSSNNLGDLSAEQWDAFIKAMAGSKITSLNLSDNHLDQCTPEQWSAFAKALSTNQTKFLYLRNWKAFISPITIEAFTRTCNTLPTDIFFQLLFNMLDASLYDSKGNISEDPKGFSLVLLLNAMLSIDLNVIYKDGKILLTIKPFQSLTSTPEGSDIFVDELILQLNSLEIPQHVTLTLDLSASKLTSWGAWALANLSQNEVLQPPDTPLTFANIPQSSAFSFFNKILAGGTSRDTFGPMPDTAKMFSIQASNPSHYWEKIIFPLPNATIRNFLYQLEKHLFHQTPLTPVLLHWLISQSQLPQGWFKLDKHLYAACEKALEDNGSLAVTLTSENKSDPQIMAIRDFQELLLGNAELSLDYAEKFTDASPTKYMWLRIAATSIKDSPTALKAAYQLGAALQMRQPSRSEHEETTLCPYYWYRLIAASNQPDAKHQLTLAMKNKDTFDPLAQYHIVMASVALDAQPIVYALAFSKLLKAGEKNWLGQVSYTLETSLYNQQILSYLQKDEQIDEEKKYQLLQQLKDHDLNVFIQNTPLAAWYQGLVRYAGKNLYRFVKEQLFPILQEQQPDKTTGRKLQQLEKLQGLATLTELQRLNLFVYEVMDVLKSYDASQGQQLFDKIISPETQPLIIYHEIARYLKVGLLRYGLETNHVAATIKDRLEIFKQQLLEPMTHSYQVSPVTAFGNAFYERLYDYGNCASVIQTTDARVKDFNSRVEQGKNAPTVSHQAISTAKKTLYGAAIVGGIISLAMPYTKVFAELLEASGQVLKWIEYLDANGTMFFEGPIKSIHLGHFISHLMKNGDPQVELQKLQKAALSSYKDLFNGLNATDADVLQVCTLHYTLRYKALLEQLTAQSAEQLAHVWADLLFRGLMHQQLDKVQSLNDHFSPFGDLKEFDLLFARLDQILWLSGLLPDEVKLVLRSGEIITAQQALFDVSLNVNGEERAISLWSKGDNAPHAHPRQASAYEIKCIQRELSLQMPSQEVSTQDKSVGFILSAEVRRQLQGKTLSIQRSEPLSIRQLFYRTEWKVQNIERMLDQYSLRIDALSWTQRLHNYCHRWESLASRAEYFHIQLKLEGFPTTEEEARLETLLKQCIKESRCSKDGLNLLASQTINSSQGNTDIEQPSLEQLEEQIKRVETQLLDICNKLKLDSHEVFPGSEEWKRYNLPLPAEASFKKMLQQPTLGSSNSFFQKAPGQMTTASESQMIATKSMVSYSTFTPTRNAASDH